ncbi:MAG: ABC transporter permease [Anaerolineaceae bacterium]|nr:ABC transporter permease [Anaerolineaceae bacterium]MCB9101179.1 ABC transporter permease [Anaerolineales bacterium]
MKRLGWLKSVFFFVVIVIVLALCWEGYKLLASEDGQFLAGTAQVKSGNERAPGPLCAGMGLCEIKLPIRADNRSMPPIKNMIATIFEPPRRGSDEILFTILLRASLFTLREAITGFLLGAGAGFLLGVAFAHSGLLERGLLPYVVASQTVPLLAIAPMVVIWLGGNWMSVAVIAAYLTFFPVTINTLRGLRSPQPTALELMHSYAATKWDILWKLRVPAAMPYIFTALKVAATASVVGAIIGELPSGIADGLGRIILNFNQYYATGPERLWAGIIFASLTGMTFFVIVTLLEKFFVRHQPADAV